MFLLHVKLFNGMRSNDSHASLASKNAQGKATPAEKAELKNLQSKFKSQSKNVQRQFEVSEDKCGGKMKKHFNGGTIDLIKLRSLLNLNK